MWHLKTITITVIEGTLSTIKNGIDKYINKISGSPSLYNILKIAIQGTVSESTINVTEKYHPKEAVKPLIPSLILGLG